MSRRDLRAMEVEGSDTKQGEVFCTSGNYEYLLCFVCSATAAKENVTDHWEISGQSMPDRLSATLGSADETLGNGGKRREMLGTTEHMNGSRCATVGNGRESQ